MNFHVALCGLTLRDERLVEIVVARTPNPKYLFKVGKAAELGGAHIAIADAASEHAYTQLAELRVLNPQLAVIFVSDMGVDGDSRYRIERRSLLLRISRVLDEVVESELLGRAPAAAAHVSALPDRAEQTAFNHAGAALEHVPLQPLRALIVDDSMTVREQLRAALGRIGILADVAEGAATALAKLNANGYDLAFLDVVMPGIDGYELCRSIKRNAYTRSVPVLMLTSRSSPFDRARGALAGCNAYLVKPITWDTFLGAVDKILCKQFHNDRALLDQRGYGRAIST